MVDQKHGHGPGGWSVKKENDGYTYGSQVCSGRGWNSCPLNLWRVIIAVGGGEVVG